MTVPTVSVDRSNPVPLYFQVAQQLEQAIASGELAVGERLENEIALADHYGLSRPTMRSAIAHLVDKGLLVRQRGVGTQVIRRRVERPVRLSSLFEDLVASDQDPTTRVLVLGRVPAEELVAHKLGIPEGTEVVHLERVRSAQERPLAVLRNWLPVDVAGDLTAEDLEAEGLYALLRGAGTEMRDATQRIGAAAADAADAKALGLRKGAPLLTVQRLSYGARGRAVELGIHAYDSSRYAFTMTLSGS